MPARHKEPFGWTRLVLVDLLVLLLILLTGLLGLLPVTVVTGLVGLGKLVLVLSAGILHVLTVARGDAVTVSVGRGEDRRGLISVAALVTVTTLVVVLRRGRRS